MSTFETAFSTIVGIEGGFSDRDRAADPGSRSKRSSYLFKGSSTFQSKFYGIPTASPSLRPFAQCSVNIIKNVVSCCSLIIGLLFWRRPSTIPFLVRAVIINSIESGSRWARPHVRQELCK